MNKRYFRINNINEYINSAKNLFIKKEEKMRGMINVSRKDEQRFSIDTQETNSEEERKNFEICIKELKDEELLDENKLELSKLKNQYFNKKVHFRIK